MRKLVIILIVFIAFVTLIRALDTEKYSAAGADLDPGVQAFITP